MTPLLTIQLLGLAYQMKMKKTEQADSAAADEEIIDL